MNVVMPTLRRSTETDTSIMIQLITIEEPIRKLITSGSNLALDRDQAPSLVTRCKTYQLEMPIHNTTTHDPTKNQINEDGITQAKKIRATKNIAWKVQLSSKTSWIDLRQYASKCILKIMRKIKLPQITTGKWRRHRVPSWIVVMREMGPNILKIHNIQ